MSIYAQRGADRDTSKETSSDADDGGFPLSISGSQSSITARRIASFSNGGNWGASCHYTNGYQVSDFDH